MTSTRYRQRKLDNTWLQIWSQNIMIKNDVMVPLLMQSGHMINFRNYGEVSKWWTFVVVDFYLVFSIFFLCLFYCCCCCGCCCGCLYFNLLYELLTITQVSLSITYHKCWNYVTKPRTYFISLHIFFLCYHD